ncbi:MAG: M15 family metallopeptidase [Bacteroidetes bacterium]|nr:M15 family metallopeptidase [Bacteroidota bacterium]
MLKGFFIILYVNCIFLVFGRCSSPSDNKKNYTTRSTTPPLQKKAFVKAHDTSDLERLFIQKQLINISSLDSGIRVVLHYSTSHNFLNKPLYNGLSDCYLPCDVAIKLCNADYFLNTQFPNYHIIVFDAVRPLHIQKQMWDELQMPAKEKINYLAHPNDISLHNYGAAVDVGIIGNNDKLLDMGTPFDFFGELSKPTNEKEFLLNGQLSQEALNNRLLLRYVMQKAGFTPITSEWWHFNSTSKQTAAVKYQLIN